MTGCGGFVGSALVRALLDQGESVVGISRRRYPDLESLGMSWARIDLASDSAVVDMVNLMSQHPIEGVVHTAAVAGIWGPRAYYLANNVHATEHLAEAAMKTNVSWMLFTSSPSVTFEGSDQSGVDESVGYANTHLCHYSETKSLAEQFVLSEKVTDHMPVIALRPHLVYGPGDPHLVPRVVERARSRRL
ncbi:MAG: NAD(P)-dependent oxidoreductase, partial [Planctomycetota bacterium]